MQDYTRQLKQLGEEVKRLRMARLFSQQELANRCDVDIRTIQRVETGEHNSTMQILCALAGALEITLPELLAKVKVPKPNYISLNGVPKIKSKKKKK